MTTPLSVGDVLLGKYRVERVLGRGGMGVVVAARHIDLGELFAIKLMLPEAEAHPEAVGRFLREARAAARLRGEHVVRVVDVGRLESGLPYMVMEHLIGSDLGALVEARGPLPVDEAVAYMTQACEGISEAHAAGIIHRDLKPANLFLIRRPNGTPCVKVLDFGIAKSLDAENVSLTATSSIIGSPQYMSPEQMMRSKSVDVRADVWSMGVVFYELLTGAVPFQGETFTEIVARVLQQEAPRPSLARTDLSPGVDALIAACLQKDLTQRIQSIDELRAALAALAALAGLDAPGGSVVVRVNPSPRSPSLGDDVLAAGGSLPMALKPTFQGSSLDSSPPAPRSKRGPLVLMGLAGGAVVLAAGALWWSRAPSGAASPAGEPPRAEAAAAHFGAPSSGVEPASIEPALLPTPSAAPTGETSASAAPASASVAPPTAARPLPTPARAAPPSASPPRAPPSRSPPKTQTTASPSTPTSKRGGIF